MFFEKVNIAKEAWLDDSLDSAIRCFKLAKENKIPDSIKGRLILTSCMRVLRAISGSDLDTAILIKNKVLEDIRENQLSTEEWDKEAKIKLDSISK